tara:strand:- start:62 stop:622 length:561 start_codon:yes stop_codon:yes gene_type:complete
MTNTKFDRYKSMTSVVKGEIGRDRTRVLINDDMKADDVKLEWFKSPKKDAPDTHREHFNATKNAVIMAFSAADRKLHNAKVSDLEAGNAPGQRGDSKKAAVGTRRYIHQQVNTKIGQFGKSYALYLHGPNKKGADNKRTTDTSYCLERIVDMRKRLEKAEPKKATFDILETIASLDNLEKLVKTIV